MVVFTENAPHRLICLYGCFSVVGIVWEGLGNMPLMEKACNLWQAFRFQAISFQSVSCLWIRHKLSAIQVLCLLSCLNVPCHESH